MQAKIDPNKFAWELPPLHPYRHLSIRRSTLTAFLGSLIVHMLALFVVPQQHLSTGEQFAKTGDPLVVDLRPRTAPSSRRSFSTAIPEARRRPPVGARHKSSSATVLALNKPRDNELAKPPSPATSPVPTQAAESLPDMQAYVNAARSRRRAAEDFSGKEDAAAAGNERGPSEDEILMARVKRNLSPGTNGVFQILHM